MRTPFLRIVVCFLIALPFHVHAKLITYDFSANGLDAQLYGSSPLLPDEVSGATEWHIQGSITIDDEIAAIYDEPYLRLGQSIVGGSLAINGVDAGAFESAAFSYYFLDGFEDDEPYAANLSMKFSGNDGFGPMFWGLYTEDFNWSGPNLEGVELTDLGSLLEAFEPTTYEEMWTKVGVGDNYWEMYMDLDSEFVPREHTVEVSEPMSAALLALGLVIVSIRQRSFATRRAA